MAQTQAGACGYRPVIPPILYIAERNRDEKDVTGLYTVAGLQHGSVC